MAVTLVEITAFDPVANAAVTVRACNADDHRVTALNGVRWWPVLARTPQRRLDLFDGDFSGQIGVGIGDLDISTKAHPDAPRYSWGERAVTVWRGNAGDAWGSYTQVFKGLTRGARGGNGRLIIGLRPDDRWLDKPLLSTYAGTGGIEGPGELKGVPKPIALGSPRFVPGVLINAALNIWQVHNGSINGVPVVYDRLARFSGPAYAGDDADYATLAAATIPNGSWRSCQAQGLVRFGAPPAVPSFDVQGNTGGSYGWARRPGSVIGRIAEIAGAVSGQINATSLTALDTWAATLPQGGYISKWLGEQITARDIIQQIAASCNAAAGIKFDGRLFVARAVIGSPSLTLAADGTRTPAVADVQLLETSAPFWRMAMTAEIAERVHGESDYGQIGFADQVTHADGATVESFKPAAPAATRNDDGGGNLIAAPRAAATWTLFGGATQPGTTLETQMGGLVVQMSAGGAGVIWMPGTVGVTAGEELFLRHQATCDAFVPAGVFVVCGANFFDTAGTLLSGADAAVNANGSEILQAQAVIAPVRAEGRLTVPAAAAFARFYTIRIGGGGGAFYANQARAGRDRIGADVTGASLPELATGAWESGRLYPIGSVVQFGAATYTARQTHTSSGGNAPPTASIWRNLVTVSDSAGAAPISFTTGSTSYGTAAAQFSVRAGSTGNVDISSQMDVQADPNNSADYGAAGKWQRETSPGTWSDVGSEQLTATNAFPGGPDSMLDVNATASGLTAGTLYNFRLLLRRSGAGPGTDTVTMSGQASGNGR